MRIYKINIEHVKFGRSWSTEKVAARTFTEAIRHAKKLLRTAERIESIELLETTE